MAETWVARWVVLLVDHLAYLRVGQLAGNWVENSVVHLVVRWVMQMAAW